MATPRRTTVAAAALRAVCAAARAAEAASGDSGTRKETRLALGGALRALRALSDVLGIDLKAAEQDYLVSIFTAEEKTGNAS